MQHCIAQTDDPSVLMGEDGVMEIARFAMDFSRKRRYGRRVKWLNILIEEKY